MDGQHFDAFTRGLARNQSRREMLKGIGGLIGVATGLAGVGEAVAGPPSKKCKPKKGSASCKGADECCAGFCYAPCAPGETRDGTCTCIHDEPESACSATQPCPDLGNRCWTDICVEGTCTQVPRDCDTGNSCIDDVCSDIDGCQHLAKPAGTECPSGFCDGQGTCRPACQAAAECPAPPVGEFCLIAVCEAGVCNLRSNPCDDGDPCMDGVCREGAGCEYVPRPAGIDCPGGVCDAQGRCLPRCQSAAECPPPPSGEECLVAVCASGVCSLRGKDCITGNPCTYDACVEGIGCVSNPGPYIGLPCLEEGLCDEDGVCVV